MPSNLRRIYTCTLGFLPTPITALLILVYLAISISVLITDQLPPVPPQHALSTRYGGLNVTKAWQDLQVIAARPHPYNSHANDLVRRYLLKRVTEIRDEVLLSNGNNIIIQDDLVSSVTWSNPTSNTTTYFEGTNILVKIPGTASTSLRLPAILFSAHYDSVSAASGATDDGMGVVTLLQLIRYFGMNPPSRTVVFNINNGEEDGLNGARAFLEHPWVKGSSSSSSEEMERIGMFVNLEGASEGGRPLMFRTTSLNVLKGWKRGLRKSYHPHPHANVISGEAFERGVVRSATDYEVYTSAFASRLSSHDGDPGPDFGGYGPMEGLDLSFYRGRALYHTKFDRVVYTKGGERALWAMMEGAWGMGVGLVSEESGTNVQTNGKEGAVYFDLFNETLLLFSLPTLLTFNICALVVGPLVLILLAICESALEKARKTNVDARAEEYPRRGGPSLAGAEGVHAEEEGAGQVTDTRAETAAAAEGEGEGAGTSQNTLLNEGWWRGRRRRLYRRGMWEMAWRHAKFWVGLVGLVGVQIGLVQGFVRFNPFIVYSYPWIPLLTSLSFSLVILSLILAPPLPSFPISTPWAHFRTNLTHTYIFTWILLVLSTIGITKAGMGGGTYMVSAWNGVVWVGCAICLGAGCFGVNGSGGKEEGKKIRWWDGGEASGGGEVPEVHEEHGEDDERGGDTNERTPLLSKSKASKLGLSSKAQQLEKFNSHPHILPYLLLILLIPLPLTLSSHILLILLSAISQTLADGSPPILPYAATALLSVLCVLPLAPFVSAGKVKKSFVVVMGVVGAVGVLLGWVGWNGTAVGSRIAGGNTWKGGLFPFNEGAPLKVFFQQKVQVVHSAAVSEARTHISTIEDEVRIISTLTGAEPFIQEMILPGIPSYVDALANGRKVGCERLGKAELKVGLVRCEWEVGLRPVPGTNRVGWSGASAGRRWNWDWSSSASTSTWFSARAVRAKFNRSSTLSTSSDSMAPLSFSSSGSSESSLQSSFGSRSKSQVNPVAMANEVSGARFEVEGTNTRACRVYFDQPVRRVRVSTVPGSGTSTSSSEASTAYTNANLDKRENKKEVIIDDDGKGWEMQRGYTTESIKELRLWSREWGKKFIVDVEWAEAESESRFGSDAESSSSSSSSLMEAKAAEQKRTGRVACEWVEYESGMVGMGTGLSYGGSNNVNMDLGSRIPAYEEILMFLPKWAVASKLTDGLVEVEEGFEF